MTVSHTHTLWSLFTRFLRFGLLAWGGPVAQIGLLREELVERENWVEPRRFDRVLALYQALPGPEAFELCVFFGMTVRGRLGGLVAGLGFALPGATAVALVAWLYAERGIDGQLALAMAGLQVGAVALVVRAVHKIGGSVLRDGQLWLIALMAVVATLAGTSFVVVLGTGAVAYALTRLRWGTVLCVVLVSVVAVGSIVESANRSEPGGGRAGLITAAPNAGDGTLAQVARTGLTAGALSFGGAYTSVGFVRDDAVVRRGWLTDAQLLDALAVSGALPAPMVVFATFVGYLAASWLGALAITVAIFLPALVITLAGHRTLERIVEEPRIHHLLDGLTAAVVGLIAATALTLGRAAVEEVWQVALLLVALIALVRWHASITIVAVMVGCALAGVAAPQLV